MLNRHHGDHDYEAIINGGLGQKSVEALSPIHGDQCEAQHREYLAHHHSVYTLDLITEVVDLKAALTLGLHLMRACLRKACDHLCSGKEVLIQLGLLRVMHSWRSSNGADEIIGHIDLRASNPSGK